MVKIAYLTSVLVTASDAAGTYKIAIKSANEKLRSDRAPITITSVVIVKKLRIF